MKKIIDFDEMKRHKIKAVVYIVLRLVTVATLIFSMVRGQWENAMTCMLTLALLFVPLFIERKMKIMLPSAMEVLVISFVFAANIMGEISSMYVKFPLFDTILHTINGFICAGVGFGLIDILNRDERVKINLSPIFVCLFSFCFSMTAGTVWEFFEFSMDFFFAKDMQKDTVINTINSTLLSESGEIIRITDITTTAVNSTPLNVNGYLDIGLYDTMKDLLVNFAGALMFNTAGWFYLKSRGKLPLILKNFIPSHKKTSENQSLFT